VIQLKETDLMWKVYCRYYKGYSEPPHPNSLCNFFWKSVGGMLAYLSWDLPAFLVISVLYTLTYGAGSLAENLNGNSFQFLAILSFMFLGVASLVVTVSRFADWCQRTNRQHLGGLAFLAVIVGFFTFLFGLLWGGKEGGVMSFVYGFFTTLVVGGGLCGYFYLYDRWKDPNSQTGAIIKEYYLAVKSRVCPRIMIPGEGQTQEVGGGS
jgi:hypothetical protein